MHIFQFGKTEFVLGLQWTNLGSEKIDAEAISVSEELSLPLGVIIDARTGQGNSSQVGLTDDTLAKGKVAGAAIIAMNDKNVIHVEHLDDDLYWLCAVSDNEVISGFDKVLTFDVLLQELDEAFSFMANVLDSTILRWPEEVAAEKEVEVDEYISFDEIVQNLEQSKNKKILAQYRVSKLRRLPRSLYLFVGFVAACSLAGYFILDNEKKVVIPEDFNVVDTAPVTVQSVATSKKEATQSELLEKAREEEIQWLQHDFESQDPVEINNQFVKFVATMPQVIGGWELKGIRYNRKNPRILEVAWGNIGNGTSLTLKKSLGNMASNFEFDLQGERAKSFHHAIHSTERRYDNYENIIDFIGQAKYSHDELMHDLKSLQYKWQMSYHAVTKRPVKIAGIKDASAAETRQLNLNIKDFKISGSGLVSLQSLNMIFEKANTALIRRIEITNNNGIQWTVIGELYEN